MNLRDEMARLLTTYAELTSLGGPGHKTLHAWASGKTKTPQPHAIGQLQRALSAKVAIINASRPLDDQGKPIGPEEEAPTVGEVRAMIEESYRAAQFSVG